MKWLVNIEGKKDLRILVKFDPKNELIIFVGQLHRKIINEWVDFCEESYSMNIDLEKIQELMLKTYNVLKTRVDAYNNIAEGFNVIKTVQIIDE